MPMRSGVVESVVLKKDLLRAGGQICTNSDVYFLAPKNLGSTAALPLWASQCWSSGCTALEVVWRSSFVVVVEGSSAEERRDIAEKEC